MPIRRQSESSEAQLLAALHARAASLPSPAAETARLLEHYAAEIENPAATERALVEFHQFTLHFKGLRDIIVPGISEQEWFSSVTELRRLARAARRARGLDSTFIGRLHTFVRSLFGA